MKIDRLMGILTVLLRNEKVTAPYLAEKFEVSRRTINRDIEDICKAGIPIVTTQGFDGGISIESGYKIDKTVFTKDELQAVFAGLKSLESISKVPYTERIIDKLSSDKAKVISADESMIIDLASYYKDSLSEKIEKIKSAISEKNLISFKYFYNKGEADKLIEPYLIVFRWSAWYVFGYCEDNQDFRMFKLNRLWELSVSDNKFEQREIPKERLDFESCFTAGIQLIAEFDESVKYRLIEEYGPDCFTYTDSGKLRFEFNFTFKENMISWILGFGDKVKVISPESVQKEIKEQAENVLNIYDRT